MSEVIDLVDGRGNIIQRNVLRDDAARYDGLHMQIIIAIVTNSLGHVLVQKRAQTKRVNPGDIDHICGAIISGETPEQAAHREALEETGVRLSNLVVIRQGSNPYGHYCYLVRATSEDEPPVNHNPREVAWAAYHPVTDLYDRHKTGEFTFVDGFFADLQYALNA